MVQNEINRQEFAKRLLIAAEKAGYSGHGVGVSLSKLFKVTPKAVSKWLNAESLPSRTRIGQIADVLSVNRAWLEYGEGEMTLITRVGHLGAILEMGLSDDQLRQVEEYARFLLQREREQK